MGSYNDIEEFLKDLKKRLKSQMPKIREEIRVYENKVKEGKLNPNPHSAPQFNE